MLRKTSIAVTPEQTVFDFVRGIACQGFEIGIQVGKAGNPRRHSEEHLEQKIASVNK
ncbi:hypothetical protein AALB47_15515 [Lachnospiraceae bacterium 54-11]|nr:hypothetical protein [Lachnospiraceae bacterium]